SHDAAGVGVLVVEHAVLVLQRRRVRLRRRRWVLLHGVRRLRPRRVVGDARRRLRHVVAHHRLRRAVVRVGVVLLVLLVRRRRRREVQGPLRRCGGGGWRGVAGVLGLALLVLCSFVVIASLLHRRRGNGFFGGFGANVVALRLRLRRRLALAAGVLLRLVAWLRLLLLLFLLCFLLRLGLLLRLLLLRALCLRRGLLRRRSRSITTLAAVVVPGRRSLRLLRRGLYRLDRLRRRRHVRVLPRHGLLPGLVQPLDERVAVHRAGHRHLVHRGVHLHILHA
ncbi:Os03g0345901, partial [Oryza sativa Japonica Group]